MDVHQERVSWPALFSFFNLLRFRRIHFTKDLHTKDVRLTLAKIYPDTMNTINTYVYAPGTTNIIKFKPVPDIEVYNLDDKTDVNSTSVIKWDLENLSDSFMNCFCRQLLKRVYGQMMQDDKTDLNSTSVIKLLLCFDDVSGFYYDIKFEW